MGTSVAAKKAQPVEANHHQMKLLGMDSIESVFPVTFKGTSFKMETINFTCGNCEHDIPMAEVRGNFSRLIEPVVDMDVVGKCPHCGFITPFRIRVNSDRRCEWQTMDGAWKSYKVYAPTKKGVMMALKELFSAIKERAFGGNHG